jgi:tetratricopeptide (TPR) repeat protein
MHLWLAACASAGDLEPWVFHAALLALHAAVVACVYLVLRRWASEPGSLVGALWFAVHPVHAETVAWVSGVVDVSCALFALLTLLAAVSERPWLRRAAPVLFFAALLSKEPALMVLPVVGIALAGRPRAELARRMGGLAIAFGVYLGLRVHALGGLMAGAVARHTVDLSTGVATALALVPRYAAKLLAPIHLSAVYDLRPGVDLPLATMGLALVVGSGFLAWRLRGHRGALLGLALLWAPLLPALYVPVLGDGLIADRYLYLPSAGAALLLALLLNRVRAPLRVLVPASVVALALLAVGTVVRNGVWRSDLSLWTDAALTEPESATAHENLGAAQHIAGDYPGAIRSLTRALEIDPSRRDARVNLAAALCAIGRAADGAREASAAVVAHPGYPPAWAILGYALGMLGERDQAARAIGEGLRLAPGDATLLSYAAQLGPLPQR